MESTLSSATIDPAVFTSETSRRSVSITIDLSAIRSNLVTARRCSGGSRQFATIKADAYGHGAVAVAHALSPPSADGPMTGSGDGNRLGGETSERINKRIGENPEDSVADGFAVVTVDEALELRQSGIKQPILVLQGPQSADACPEMKRHDLWPVIHDMHQYAWYRRCVEREALHAWLKVDTGMGRLGMSPEQANAVLGASEGIRWFGLLTHFACADEPDNAFTARQIDLFNTVNPSMPLQRSLANSAAVLAWPRARADWARPGIMLYGCNPLDRALPEGLFLRPAMSVSAPIISVKHTRAGAGIGYAQTYHCPEDMPIGYVALGYRDGLPRVLDNSATVTVEGTRCPVVGRVSMDSVAVDLRHSPTATPGTAAQFWGENACIDALARSAGTINYELLTSIRGQREYIMRT